ncbi:MAG: hypothetical protein CMC96_11115 [Flavobacteriales bacterium]|nr:hypothetical protein [Flavobacteriales bacterium]|tara:strand:- start:926 stop:1135 length:210 start_codon:yes stop_codon:yes gene_type:complete
MDLAEQKISLIQWIIELEDEQVIKKLEVLRSLDSKERLPNEVIELLELSSKASLDDCIKHTRSKNLISK